MTRPPTRGLLDNGPTNSGKVPQKMEALLLEADAQVASYSSGRMSCAGEAGTPCRQHHNGKRPTYCKESWWKGPRSKPLSGMTKRSGGDKGTRGMKVGPLHHVHANTSLVPREQARDSPLGNNMNQCNGFETDERTSATRDAVRCLRDASAAQASVPSCGALEMDDGTLATPDAGGGLIGSSTMR